MSRAPESRPARRGVPREVELIAATLDPGVDPFALLAEVPPDARPILLEGPAGDPSRHTWLCFDPLETCDDVERPSAVRSQLAGWRARIDGAITGPFRGGFVGALAYDLGVEGEALDLPADPWGWPRVLGGVYGDFVHADRESGAVQLVLARRPGECDVSHRRARVDDWIERAQRRRRDGGAGGDAEPDRRIEATRHVSPSAFRAQVERARAAIADGDYYQANLSHRVGATFEGDGRTLYARLRRANPAPYMGFVEHPSGAICSSSPELLFEFDGRVARSRPIKGTCRRSDDPVEDERARAALLASAKDRAELAMIVDLVRNDLGRIASVGGVEVPELFRLETFAHVHHLVATIEARVEDGRDAFDLLDALFPGGSITGAPKLASMRAIAAIEGEGRGPFTGSLGFVGFDGAACFNILIRTLLARPNAAGGCDVSFRVGGGITHRSDARAEDEETMAKAHGLLAALGADGTRHEVDTCREVDA